MSAHLTSGTVANPSRLADGVIVNAADCDKHSTDKLHVTSNDPYSRAYSHLLYKTKLILKCLQV